VNYNQILQQILLTIINLNKGLNEIKADMAKMVVSQKELGEGIEKINQYVAKTQKSIFSATTKLGNTLTGTEAKASGSTGKRGRPAKLKKDQLEVEKEDKNP